MQPLQTAARALLQGGVIAHATEGVWGLAADPSNRDALLRILTLKQRAADKGLLLLAAHADEFAAALAPLDFQIRQRVQSSWPGHVTWVLPNSGYNDLVTGGRNTVACRVPDHEQARQLAEAFGGPIVSTSLNRAGEEPVLDYEQAQAQFGDELDFVLPGQTAGATGPSKIVQVDGTALREHSAGKTTGE
ncbi:MAG: L-threonylcarbamoyladenylate synthase [Pseudomonadales bacterium]